MWKLKDSENEFQVIREGSFAYHTFRHGETYENIPDEEGDRFESIDIIEPEGGEDK